MDAGTAAALTLRVTRDQLGVAECHSRRSKMQQEFAGAANGILDRTLVKIAMDNVCHAMLTCKASAPHASLGWPTLPSGVSRAASMWRPGTIQVFAMPASWVSVRK